MRPLDDVLGAFKRDWMAGAQPDIDAYVAQVPADQQDALVDLIDTWLAVAPDVELAPGALEARVAADPALAALAAAYDAAPGSLATLVPRLRATRNWSVGDLAAAFVQRVGLPVSSTGKVGDYLHRVEHSEHDCTSLSRKALDALGDLLGVGSEALARAASPAF
ncbi:MAG: helix-turn-helix protein, partial [Solirubrobacterales bacterium]|nr:helix-turn-helix protein [Solirubrobacterales bacterium]